MNWAFTPLDKIGSFAYSRSDEFRKWIMEKNRKWHFVLIVAVALLTVYNILPTVFYYLKPLHEPVSVSQSEQIISSIERRVNGLEEESKKWLVSFCDLLHIKPISVTLTSPLISVRFAKTEEADRFRSMLPRAGALISFPAMQLKLSAQGDDAREVLVQRSLSTQLEGNFFSYVAKDSPESRVLCLDQSASSESSGFIVFKLDALAKSQSQKILSVLRDKWAPKHPDFQSIPIVDAEGYEGLSPEQKTLCLIAGSPLNDAMPGLNGESLYLIVKGIERIAKNYEQFPNIEPARVFQSDLSKLDLLLRQNDFFAAATVSSDAVPFAGDFCFEKTHFARPLLVATREDFVLHGSKKYAVLTLSTHEQRLLTENKIETRIHEELIKWDDEYRSKQVHPDRNVHFETPRPTHSVLFSNMALSLRKLFRGDDKKILRWGLDLSGGKTVQIELRDANHDVVKSDADLKLGLNELYSRINKMGVSDVSIRQVGHHIVLDFPGSQSLSAKELIQSSSMYFHVVNEKFSLQSPTLGSSVHQFLQEVWNEALLTGKKDSQSINDIATRHLLGDKELSQSESARTLWENGLRLQTEDEIGAGYAPEDHTSKIAIFRGTEVSDWQGQANPLLIVFRNIALEGAHLDNIRSSYDPSKGNYLSFEVIRSLQNKNGDTVYPQNNLYAWTSRFSKEQVAGTPDDLYSRGNGWRMAVVLNDSVINAPTLSSSLRDSAMISGNFSQTEVQRLVADLKAGSLTFTPHILSEKNVSPELGQTDRMKGIFATVVALVLVIGSMLVYYRFAGFVASCAVLFNLLILWAVLQNLGASLTLSGIAGIILTVGMSIDANVLVFERIKEEFAISKKISSAIAIGYKKAFSAIIDSNITTIIVALILMNYDAGPVKSFAVILVIGIVSSMFTALFMTRFYFNRWVQNPKNTSLKMADWIRATKFNFLQQTKVAFVSAAIIIVAGSYFVFAKSSTILGLDFTGGFSLHLELEPDDAQKYAERVSIGLQANGAEKRDFQIQELSPVNHLRLLFSPSMEQKGKPFASSEDKKDRISWVVHALQTENLSIAPEMQLESNWTSISGQMSDTMRKSAIIGLLLSFIGIFIYLAFRFEYKFAAAALLCLVHDVLITLGCMGILHALGVPLQIDLHTIAALMTIVGYSLNDTIIIFDRIREEMRISNEKNLIGIINRALNATLSRTMITSGTTLFVLIALVVLGGVSIFSFALVMTIGVIFGTLSSWFIATPLMLFFHRREEVPLLVKTVQMR